VTGALRYLVRRAAVAVVLLLALSLISFTLYYKIPTDPAGFLIDLSHNPDRAEVAAARKAMHVDGSVFEQYVAYVGRALHGDLGIAWSSSYLDDNGELQGRPVREALLDGARVTGSVVLGGLVFLLLLAIPAGVLAARRPGGIFDRLTALTSTAAIATHPLVVALLLQLFVARRWGVLPDRGYCQFRPLPPDPDAVQSGYGAVPLEVCSGAGAWAQHLILPWITFGLFFTALYLRMTRSRMIEALGEPHIRTARAKGASEGRVLRGHALRLGLTPVVTMLGLDVGLAVGMTIYVEAVFGLPGIGGLTLRALSLTGFGFDLPLILGVIMLTGLVIVLVNLLVDAVHVLLDPRLRTG
jgi:peptide/nickel transport system permease protein